MLRTFGVAAAAALTAFATTAEARDQIRIVGSSTVYPFASYAVEEFGATTQHPTPVIESTGSGGGLKLFCAGNGMETPDITNASRRIKVSEFKRCQQNGVDNITEAVIGFDGIVLANATNAPQFQLTREQVTLAVAAEVPQDGKLVKNPYTHWDDIDASLPNEEILIYGPPTTSGTRDAFEELVMEAASEEMDGYGGEYTKIRQDGAFVPAGENDNLIVQKLVQNKNALGIFGYSFLEENTDRIQGSIIDGVAPEPDAISSGEYPVSRSLFFYVKNSHADKVPGLYDYVNMFLSEKMIGQFGYLKDLGLISLPKERREAIREQAKNRTALQLSDLQ
ncbi:MAG TPA: PstS family phosphate ABC transporter substrate-binding protein [Gammaproteobacteria bacterium]|nr:PstS family phosphate ABC transporter substrate-binding protein [Gammaproteobacteria bacterium]